MKIISSELYVKDNKVYHEGNKPKPKDIGAAPETHTHNYASATTPGGSAEHAIKATEDSLGQRIDKYIKGLSVSGRTITYTRGDGTTGTITTQDNDTKVTNTLNTTAKAYITGTTNSATNTGTQVFDTNVYLDTTAGMLTATTFKGALQGNAATATSATSASHAAKLTTPRSINGTNFDGTAAITTANWGTARTLTIGNTGKSVNGSGNVSWSIGEIGAAPTVHNHTSLTGITNLSFAAEGTDSASITTTVEGPNTYFDFNLSDDPSQNDMWRWRFRPSGGNLFNAMTLDAISTTEAKLAVTGEVQATRLKGTLTGDVKGNVTGTVSGNAGSATKLATARTINGTSFDGTGNITTANWGTARTITIGKTGKSVNGSGNVSWSLSEIGAIEMYNIPNSASSKNYSRICTMPANIGTGQGGLSAIIMGASNYGGTEIPLIKLSFSTRGYSGSGTIPSNVVNAVALGQGNNIGDLSFITKLVNNTVELWMSASPYPYPIKMIVFNNSQITINCDSNTTTAPTGTITTHTIAKAYTSAHKPSASEIGAAPSSHTHSSLKSTDPVRPTSANVGVIGDRSLSMMLATSNMTTAKPVGDGYILNFNWDNTGGYTSQLYVQNSSNPKIQVRGMSGGTWGNWNTVYATNNKPTASEIGAAAASHTHNYAPISHEQDYAGTNSNTYIAYPKDGRYRGNSNNANVTGYLKITLPQTWTSTMMKFDVDVFNYVDNETMTYTISGYNYSNGANSAWHNVTAACKTHQSNPKRNLSVRFGHDGTKCAIYIGEASTVWAYPQVTVKNITVGYSNYALTSWNAGWVVGYTTTLGTINKTVTNPYVGNGGMASTANTLATARTINGTSFNGSANITTANWGTARNIQIGNTAKSVNGSANVTWSLSEIGAAASNHTHSYLPLSGGTLTSSIKFSGGGYNNHAIRMEAGDANGAFIGIGAGGLTVIGSGESTNAVRTALTNGADETMIVASDQTIRFLTGMQNGYSSAKEVSINAAGVINAPQGMTGNASTATKLQTARTINGTNFDGTGNITTANWGTARNIQIGNTAKSVNGSGNVTWTLGDIGAAPASHTHGLINLNSEAFSGGNDLNTYNSTKTWVARTLNSTTNRPADYFTVANFGAGVNSNFQLAHSYGNSSILYVRGRHDTSGNYTPWAKVYTDKNKPTASEIGAAASSSVGTLSSLKTSAKENLVAAINEVFQSGNSVKQNLVDTLIAKGAEDISTSNSWDSLIDMIEGSNINLAPISFNVEPVPDAQYGFVPLGSGYYESTNIGIHSSYAMCKLNIVCNNNYNVYLDCISYGESKYDYGIISKINTPLLLSNIADANGVLYSFYGESSPNVKTIQLSSESGFYYIKYIKDSTQSTGNDSLRFKVRFEKKTGGNPGVPGNPGGKETILFGSAIGGDNRNLTGGYTHKRQTSGSYFMHDTSCMDFMAQYNGRGGSTLETVISENKINLTNYSRLRIKGYFTTTTNDSGGAPLVGVDAIGNRDDAFAASIAITSSGQRYYDLDISNLTGNYHLKFNVATSLVKPSTGEIIKHLYITELILYP